MKKIIVVSGSPHVGGVTDFLTEEVLKRFRAIPNTRVIHITLRNLNFSFCKGCYQCRDSGICVLNDDFREVLPEFYDFDVFINIFPLYFMGPPAILKSFIDRFQNLYLAYKKDKRLFSGKRQTFILGCGGSVDLKNPMSAPERIFKALCLSIGAHLNPPYYIPGTEDIEEVRKRRDVFGKIDELIKEAKKYL